MSKYGFENLVPRGSNADEVIPPRQTSAKRPSSAESSLHSTDDNIFIERSSWRKKLLTVSVVALGIAGGSYLICGSEDDNAKKKPAAPAGQTAKPPSAEEGQTELPPQQPTEPQTKGFDVQCKILYNPATGRAKPDCKEPGTYIIEFDDRPSKKEFFTGRILVDQNGDSATDAKCEFILSRPKDLTKPQELHRTEEDKPLRCLPIDNK